MKLAKQLLLAVFCLLLITKFTFANEDEDDEMEIEDVETEVIENEDLSLDEADSDPAMTEAQEKEIASGIIDTSSYPGRIISRKKVISKVPAAGQPLEFEYTIWNVGNSNIENVELIDNTFSAEDFVEAKTVSIKKEIIKPGESYKEIHSVIPKMNDEAKIKLQPAKVTYKTKTSNDNDELLEYSSDGATDGIVPIKTAAFYARNVASHYTDWLIFLAMAGASTILPYTTGNKLVEKYTKAKTA